MSSDNEQLSNDIEQLKNALRRQNQRQADDNEQLKNALKQISDQQRLFFLNQDAKKEKLLYNESFFSSKPLIFTKRDL